MATINFATREIQAKVVYFGPTGAGCTTNLENLHTVVVADRKSALHGFGLPDTAERSWYFEYATDGPIDGFGLNVQVYCLPGAIEVEVHRQEVMADVDGVVLVADARTDKNVANLEALLALEGLLRTAGRDLPRLPVVIQVNHTDSPDARFAHDVVFDLNPFGFPVVPAIARAGRGVVETHDEIVTALRARLRNTLTGQLPGVELTAIHDARRASDANVIESHLAAIHNRAKVTPQLEQVPAPAEAPPPELSQGPEVEVPFQPRSLVGCHPVEVLGAELDGDRVRVELVMERMGGGERWRTMVLLLNRPTDSVPRSPIASAAREIEGGEVFDYLPPEEEEAESEEAEPEELPGITYGVLGVAGGVVIGALSAYLAGLV